MSSATRFRTALGLLFAGIDRASTARLVGANLLAVASGALAGLAPLALKEMIDAAGQATNGQHAALTIAASGTAYLLCLSVGRLTTELRPPLISAAEQRMYARLRGAYFRQLLNLPLAFHLRQRHGALVQRLQQAIAGYQIILFSFVHAALPVCIEGLTLVLVLVSLGQPELTGTFALTTLAYCLATARHTQRLSAAARKVSDASIDAYSMMADRLKNYEPIKCFQAEGAALHCFSRSTARLEGCWARLQRRRLNAGLAVTAIFTASLILSVLLATRAVADGRLTLGGFVLVSLYMVQMLRPLETLNNAVRDVTQGLAFVVPLIEVMNEPIEEQKQLAAKPSSEAIPATTVKPRPPPRASGPSLSFRSIQLAFGSGELVLKDLSLHVPAGRSVGIVGASGCGKSSLVRLLMRLHEPLAGDIILNSCPIDRMPLTALRAMIAVVPQDITILNASIAANISIGRSGATAPEIERVARLAVLDSFVTALPRSYDTQIGEGGMTLSGGERQRIAIARALLRDPLVYVFDEATSMLDSQTEAALVQNLREASAGRTTITIAHRLSTIQHADEIAVIADGVVAERGSHTELMNAGGRYAEMWRIQQGDRHMVRP